MKPLLPLLLACLCAVAQAQTYRWTDANGRTIVSDTPPPANARQVSRTRTPTDQAAEIPFAARLAAEKHPVTLYTSPDCVEHCKAARDLLTTRQIPFTEKMLEKAEEMDELKALVGDLFVPSLKVGSKNVRGYEAAAYNNLLDLAGYPKRPAGKAGATGGTK